MPPAKYTPNKKLVEDSNINVNSLSSPTATHYLIAIHGGLQQL